MARNHVDSEVTISDIRLVLRAAVFAAHKHRDQQRKGVSQRPYIGHTLEVAEMIARVGGETSADVLAAAILHDTVEDTETTIEEIGTEFGGEIQSIVAEVTDPPGLTGEPRREYQVAHVPHISKGAKLIKLADKISNVSEIMTDPPRHWDATRRSRYYAWAGRVVEAISPINAPLEELFRKTLADAVSAMDKEIGAA